MYKKVIEKLDKFGLTWFLVVGMAVFVFLFWLPDNPELAKRSFGVLFSLLPLVLPFFLISLWEETWMEYIRLNRYLKTDHTLLEVKLPDEVTQTPYAMELVLRALYQSGEVDTPIHTHIRGNTRAWFSLEIASMEGNVRFYVWTRSRYRELVEAQLYAHYPAVQVYEVTDYTLSVPFDLTKMDIWGVEFTLQKADPYPITTYVEMGLDKLDTKEEYKHDPINSIVEFFGSMKKGEYAWMQLVVRGHTYPTLRAKEYMHKAAMIDKWAEYEISKIASKTADVKGVQGKPVINYSRLTKGEQQDIAAMQQKMEKQLFDVGLRMAYLCKTENCDISRRAGFPSVMRTWEHGSEGRGLNGFKPIFVIGPFDYPWQDFREIRRRALKRRLYEGFVFRQYFFPPFAHRSGMVLNLEEIASVYHYPGRVAKTPTLERMLSKRSDAPSNLPT